jgi:hypothetical protein
LQLIKDWKSRGYAMMVIHHLLSPCLHTTTLYILPVPFGLYIMSLCLLCEVTTPFLHIRWFLSTLGLKGTRAYAVNGLVFTVTFLAVRGLLMTAMFVQAWSDPRVPGFLLWPGCALCTLILAGAWAFLLLQYVWCVKVLSGSLAYFRAEGRSKAR